MAYVEQRASATPSAKGAWELAPSRVLCVRPYRGRSGNTGYQTRDVRFQRESGSVTAGVHRVGKMKLQDASRTSCGVFYRALYMALSLQFRAESTLICHFLISVLELNSAI